MAGFSALRTDHRRIFSRHSASHPAENCHISLHLCLPARDNILRCETKLGRQMYRAMTQLGRMRDSGV